MKIESLMILFRFSNRFTDLDNLRSMLELREENLDLISVKLFEEFRHKVENPKNSIELFHIDWPNGSTGHCAKNEKSLCVTKDLVLTFSNEVF